MERKASKTDNSQLWKYSGMVMQFFTAIGLTVWLGILTDKKLNAKIPIATWVFPLLAIIGIIIKVIRDTSVNKDKSGKK